MTETFHLRIERDVPRGKVTLADASAVAAVFGVPLYICADVLRLTREADAAWFDEHVRPLAAS